MIILQNIFWFGRNNFQKKFNISENNIISVELAEVLMYFGLHMNSLDFSFGKVIRGEDGCWEKGFKKLNLWIQIKDGVLTIVG